MNIFWLCLRSLWSSRRKEEDEQMIWWVLEVEELQFEKEGPKMKRGFWACWNSRCSSKEDEHVVLDVLEVEVEFKEEEED